MSLIYRRFVFALVPLFIFFGSAEFALRIMGWPEVKGTFEHNEPFWIVDPNLKNHNMPHKEESTSFLVSTNEDGLRTKHDSVNTKKTHRIMTMGCSTTFGWGVADQQTYPARLQSIAQEEGFSVEVINAGQPGYTSFQGSWLWEQVLKEYTPDVVLIGFIVQDARKAAYSDKSQAILQSDSRFLKDNFLYRSKVYLGLRYSLGKVQVQAKERSSQDEGGAYRVPPEDYVDNLRGLVSSIQQNGATPVLFGYPLERTGYTQMHRKILKAAAVELQIPFFDPQIEMEDATRTSTLYFANDKGHANAPGNDLIATWVFEFLKENQLLGR